MSLWILFIAALYFVEQNRYFGWNGTPQSDTELIADGIVLLLLALAVKAKKETP